LVDNTNQKEMFFCHDAFAIMQLKDELPVRHFLTHVVPQNARFLEQLAAGSVRKALSDLQGTARRRPIVLPGERPALEHELEQQHPIVSIKYE
jgi:hypothetical protein